MTLNRLLCSAVVAALMTPAVVALADSSAKELQHARHEHYEELGDAFKVVRDQTRSGSPDLTAIKTAAKTVNDAAANQEKWFPAGTGPEAGKTQALADIWAKPAEFKAAMKMFSVAAPKLNVAAIKTAFGDVGKSCKNCHDQFRAKDKD
jgi:cytochrome c556